MSWNADDGIRTEELHPNTTGATGGAGRTGTVLRGVNVNSAGVVTSFRGASAGTVAVCIEAKPGPNARALGLRFLEADGAAS